MTTEEQAIREALDEVQNPFGRPTPAQEKLVLAAAEKWADALSTPPADDVREALATKWLTSYHGSIDATALTLAFKAGYAAAEVRPRGTVTPPADDVREALDLDSLEANARAATPGPWQALTTGARGGDHWYIVDDDESIAHISANDGEDEDRREPNARYMAAASPDVVLALIERIRAAEVRPHGTVADAEVEAALAVLRSETPGKRSQFDCVRAALEAAWGAQS